LLLFEKSEDEEKSRQALLEAEKIANMDSAKILENEFVKLSSIKGAPERKITQTSRTSKRESVPPYLRKILQSVYEGKCQLTQFTFISEELLRLIDNGFVDELENKYSGNARF